MSQFAPINNNELSEVEKSANKESQNPDSPGPFKDTVAPVIGHQSRQLPTLTSGNLLLDTVNKKMGDGSK